MNYFYVLQSLAVDWRYYGSSDDLASRLKKHNAGLVKSTKAKTPYRVLYYQAYETLAQAKRREYNIKHNWAAKEELKKRILPE